MIFSCESVSLVIRASLAPDDWDRRVSHHMPQGAPQGLRGIGGPDGVRFLPAVQEGYEQGAHGIEAVGIAQGAHALPQ